MRFKFADNRGYFTCETEHGKHLRTDSLDTSNLRQKRWKWAASQARVR